MAVDTPATIAIVGAGPIGLEAALYARYLGYDVVVYERGRIAEHVQQWGHVRMFSPFAANRSPLGLAALKAQDEAWQPPADDALLTGSEYYERYLRPLAESDLLADSLRLGQEVVAIGRENFLKGELPGAEERGEFDFRLLVRDAEGRDKIEHADVVLDASGVLATPNWLGCAGVPAAGELALRDQVEYGLPDVLGDKRDEYAGRHTLVIGGGLSAAATVVALAELARERPETRITWITRREPPAHQSGPVPVLDDDPYPARRELAQRANELCKANDSPVTYHPLTDVESLARSSPNDPFQVELSGELEGVHAFDRIVASVGYRPDNRIYAELQVQESYSTGGLKALAPESAASPIQGPLRMMHPEPNFYILGAKSYGRDSSFTIADGLKQIVEVFSIIGDRATLDLYVNAPLPA